jgi:hypothetical protein
LSWKQPTWKLANSWKVALHSSQVMLSAACTVDTRGLGAEEEEEWGSTTAADDNDDDDDDAVDVDVACFGTLTFGPSLFSLFPLLPNFLTFCFPLCNMKSLNTLTITMDPWQGSLLAGYRKPYTLIAVSPYLFVWSAGSMLGDHVIL